MASAMLARQDESSWVPMGKIPFSDAHLDANPNPKPKKKQKQFHYATVNDVAGRFRGDYPSVTQTVSDDAYSFNQTSTSRNEVNYGSYLTYNVATYTNSELLGLRKRFSSELDQIRNLRDRIESGQFGIVRNPRSQVKSKKPKGSSKASGVPAMDSQRLNHRFDIPFDDAEISLNCEDMLKECKQILTKLLKHKSGWIFKSPVDAVGLGLHDYHLIVKRPMDLGTVKATLSKNMYPSPVEFAADVRLTFNNALLYNPLNDPVNGLAQQMLLRFEELFKPLQEKIDNFANHERQRQPRESRVIRERQMGGNEEFQASSWNNQIRASSPSSGKKAKPKASAAGLPHVSKKHEIMQTSMQAHSSASTASNPPPPSSNHFPNSQRNHSPVGAPLPPVKEPKVGRVAGPVKQPKPRAKDQNKREMSMEEKQKLGIGLQGMPQEKMPQLVHIIRKRNEHLAQEGDEIELDIEALDTETLWELDRFVTNWKKMVSKTKRQALMVNNNSAAGVDIPTIAESDVGAMDDENEDSGKKNKENDDEDVDIDDDTPATSFPPVEIEKDEGAGGGVGGNDHNGRGNASSGSSSSGSSSSGSSSSSDSDSGGSSGSDSDADDAQS